MAKNVLRFCSFQPRKQVGQRVFPRSKRATPQRRLELPQGDGWEPSTAKICPEPTAPARGFPTAVDWKTDQAPANPRASKARGVLTLWKTGPPSVRESLAGEGEVVAQKACACPDWHSKGACRKFFWAMGRVHPHRETEG